MKFSITEILSLTMSILKIMDKNIKKTRSPGGENWWKKTEKMQGKWKKILTLL